MKTNYNVILTLLLAFSVHFAFAQKTISGTVSDETGPLPGVSVLIKGTTRGTETDFDGNYALQANVGDVLQYSFIGMETTYKTVGTANSINVVMDVSSDNLLEEVVINALGIETRQVSRTASVSKVEGAKISKSGETSVIQGLSGKASGVSVTNSSGDPGSSAYILIRGQTSITRNLQPLFVIDGIPINNDEIGNSVEGVTQQSRINDINPDDIASVKILKGASAAALWGSRAANGVILITTKSGRLTEHGKFNVSVSTKFSFDNPLTKTNLQDIFGKGSGNRWSGDETGGSWGDKISARPGGDDVINDSGEYFEAPDGTLYYPITTKNSTELFNDKNYDAVFGQGMYVETGVSVSSKTEYGSFYTSLSRLDQDGTIGSGNGVNFYERYSGRFNAKLKVGEKLKLKGSLAYSNVNSNRIQQGSNLSGLLLGLYRTPADFDNTHYIGTHYDPSGVPNFNSHRAYRKQIGTLHKTSPNYNNPLWTIYKQKNPNEVNRYMAGLEAGLDVNDWLTLIAKVGLDSYTDDRSTLFPINSSDPSGLGLLSEQFWFYHLYNLDFIAQINKNISEDITSYFTLGANANQRTYEVRGGSYQDFILDSDQINYGNAIAEKIGSFAGSSLTRTAAFYGVANFNYKSWLLLNLSGRMEQASSFGNGEIFYYPSVELGFQFSELFESDFLNKGKIRLAWGKVGQQPSEYKTDLYYHSASGSDSYGPYYDSQAYNGAFVPESSLPSVLRPEISSEYEIGIDLNMWDNRIKLNATYYDQETNDALLFINFPASTGFSSSYANAGQIANQGIEVELDFDVIKGENFNWNIGGNWSKNNNEVTDLFGAESVFLAGFVGTSSRAVKGEALGTLWGRKFERDLSGDLILDSNGFPQQSNVEGIIGNPNPDWRAGINTSLAYKNFQLSALFDSSIGGDAWYGTFGALTHFGRTPFTTQEVTVSAADAATIFAYPVAAESQVYPNGRPIADIYGALNDDGTYTVRGTIEDFGSGKVLLNEAYYTQMGSGFAGPSEQFIVDATWAKLRELSLSYNLRGKMLDKIFLNSVNFTLTGRNLWLWTKDDLDFDPESNLTGASNGRGLQYFNHPTTKSFLASIKINF
ncbi:MAG TPA: SusC/RagA family TonB-linked outer membrane protein [Lutibacter sp.]|nr:SusC/RagA family TonB-linked outer membrane protein [Lutibacter sp.]